MISEGVRLQDSRYGYTPSVCGRFRFVSFVGSSFVSAVFHQVWRWILTKAAGFWLGSSW